MTEDTINISDMQFDALQRGELYDIMPAEISDTAPFAGAETEEEDMDKTDNGIISVTPTADGNLSVVLTHGAARDRFPGLDLPGLVPGVKDDESAALRRDDEKEGEDRYLEARRIDKDIRRDKDLTEAEKRADIRKEDEDRKAEAKRLEADWKRDAKDAKVRDDESATLRRDDEKEGEDRYLEARRIDRDIRRDPNLSEAQKRDDIRKEDEDRRAEAKRLEDDWKRDARDADNEKCDDAAEASTLVGIPLDEIDEIRGLETVASDMAALDGNPVYVSFDPRLGAAAARRALISKYCGYLSAQDAKDWREMAGVRGLSPALRKSMDMQYISRIRDGIMAAYKARHATARDGVALRRESYGPNGQQRVIIDNFTARLGQISAGSPVDYPARLLAGRIA